MKLDFRQAALMSILIGVLIALLTTIAFMAILAFVLVRFDISDGFITSLNQVIKVTSIFAGCWSGVGRGGEKGFALGAVMGLIYMVTGYAMYCLMGGSAPSNLLLVCEFAIGALIGALSGALIANLSPKKRAVRKPARVKAG